MYSKPTLSKQRSNHKRMIHFQICLLLFAASKMDVPRSMSALTKYLKSEYSSVLKGQLLCKGHVLERFRSDPTSVYEFLEAFFEEKWTSEFKKLIGNGIRAFNKDIKTQSNNISRPNVSEKILLQLSAEYSLPVTGRKRLLSDSAPPSTPSSISSEDPATPSLSTTVHTHVSSSPATPKRFKYADLETPPLTPHGPPQSPHDFITPKRSTCSECFDKRHEISNLRKELNCTKSEVEKLRTKVKQRPSVLGQTIKRLEGKVKAQKLSHEASKAKARTDIKLLRTMYNQERSKAKQMEPLLKQVEDLKSEVSKLKKDKREIKRYHKVKKGNTSPDQVKASKDKIKALKEKLSYSENRVQELECDKENLIPTMDGNQFDVKTRKSIQFCLSKNVPQHHASTVVNFVVNEMTGQGMKKMPKRSSVQNMAREMGILSNIQTGEIMVKSSKVTLGSDSTTKKGIKINETHLMTPYGPKVLGISESPGATAENQAMTTRDHLSDMISQYSEYANKNPEETSKQIHDGNYKFYVLYIIFLYNIEMQISCILKMLLNMLKLTRLACFVLSVRRRKER